LKGKWHFGATFIDNEGKNVIGCIYLMNITGARGTDHPSFSNFLFTKLFSIKFLHLNFDLGRAYYKEVYFKKSKKIYG
jgi:hypothetical protein